MATALATDGQLIIGSTAGAPAAVPEKIDSGDEEQQQLEQLDSQHHSEAPPRKAHAAQTPSPEMAAGQPPIQRHVPPLQQQQQQPRGMAALYDAHALAMAPRSTPLAMAPAPTAAPRPPTSTAAAAPAAPGRILHALRPLQSASRLKAGPPRQARDADNGSDSDFEEEKVLRAKDSLYHADAPPYKAPANILSPPRAPPANLPKSPGFHAQPPTPRCAASGCGRWALIGGLGFCAAHNSLEAIEDSQSPASRVASQTSTLALSSHPGDSLDSPNSEDDLGNYVELAGRVGESRYQRGVGVTGDHSSDESSESGSLPPSSQSAESSQARTYDSVGSFHPHLCRSGFSLPLCGAKHEMVFGSFSQPNHKCDTCDTDMPARSWGFHCALCDSDICTSCWEIDWEPVLSLSSSLEDPSQPSQPAAPGLNQDPPAPSSSGSTGRGVGAADV